ncbi:MAG TPA: hypothetical protein VN633_18165 [Bryobacteraceae bacterium]|nr:hypothetical protein [Bryobacteraceae bacterium]
MSEAKFYIVTFRHRGYDGKVLFWGPNRTGYTTDAGRAGIYSAEDVATFRGGEDIPVSVEALADCYRRTVIDPGDIGNQFLRNAKDLKTYLQHRAEQTAIVCSEARS